MATPPLQVDGEEVTIDPIVTVKLPKCITGAMLKYEMAAVPIRHGDCSWPRWCDRCLELYRQVASIELVNAANDATLTWIMQNMENIQLQANLVFRTTIETMAAAQRIGRLQGHRLVPMDLKLQSLQYVAAAKKPEDPPE